jgi:hypothetical protein
MFCFEIRTLNRPIKYFGILQRFNMGLLFAKIYGMEIRKRQVVSVVQQRKQILQFQRYILFLIDAKFRLIK